MNSFPTLTNPEIIQKHPLTVGCTETGGDAAVAAACDSAYCGTGANVHGKLHWGRGIRRVVVKGYT